MRGAMSGRRRHKRVAFENSQGVLHISHDIVVKKSQDNEFLAVSSHPGVRGDVLKIVLGAGHSPATETVRVRGSRPVLVDGAVKHELRLERIGRRRTKRGASS